MSAHAWAEVVVPFAVLLLLTSVGTVTVWQFGATWRAKALLAREDEYRTLAEKSATALAETEQRLAELDSRLADMQTRTHSVERILKDVE